MGRYHGARGYGTPRAHRPAERPGRDRGNLPLPTRRTSLARTVIPRGFLPHGVAVFRLEKRQAAAHTVAAQTRIHRSNGTHTGLSADAVSLQGRDAPRQTGRRAGAHRSRMVDGSWRTPGLLLC